MRGCAVKHDALESFIVWASTAWAQAFMLWSWIGFTLLFR
jgi:hypothetical protein